jgi:hypothetical protein
MSLPPTFCQISESCSAESGRSHAETPSSATPVAAGRTPPPTSAPHPPRTSESAFVRAGDDSVPDPASRASAKKRAVRAAPFVAGSRTSARCVQASAVAVAVARSVQVAPASSVDESANVVPPPVRRKATAAFSPAAKSVASRPSFASGPPASIGEGFAQSPNVNPPARPGSSSPPAATNAVSRSPSRKSAAAEAPAIAPSEPFWEAMTICCRSRASGHTAS